MQELNYLPGDRFFPNHPIQSAEAEPFVQVGEKNKPPYLEGICFDRTGDYAYFTAIFEHAIMRMDMKTGELAQIYKNDSLFPAAVKVHKDGRLFICGVSWPAAWDPTTKGPGGRLGGIFSINPDGTGFETILSGWCVDDLVFDSKGGFYFTHFIGNLEEAVGGIYYLEPDMITLHRVYSKLRTPNGLALSKDEKILWVTETVTGNVIRFDLTNAGHSIIVYHMEGGNGCDSCSIDDDDNLYVAHLYGGRIVVLNPVGVAIGQITMPGREEGHFLHTTHAMVAPGKKELYITATDETGLGSIIFKGPSFAVGNTAAYQFQ